MNRNVDAKNSEAPRRDVPPISIWVTNEERAAILTAAKSCGLSASAYARNLTLGYRPSSILDLEETRKMFALKADLGRLGGLLKLWLSDPIQYNDRHGEPIEELLTKLNEAQDRLMTIIRRVDERIRK